MFKVFLCVILITTLSLITHEEVIRLLTLDVIVLQLYKVTLDKTFSCINELLPKSETKATSTSSQDLASVPPSLASLIKEPLTGKLPFHHETSWQDA